MEEKKTLKIKKPYLIIFALAIAFAIMGFIDLKVNASDGYAVNVQYITHGYNGSGNEIETRTTDLGSIVSTAPIDAYYYTSYDKPVATAHKYTVFLVSEQPMTDNDVQTTLNGTTVYICMFGPVNAGLYYDGGGYLEPLISGNRYSYDLNTDYSDIRAFATALSSNTLDCEQIIDYSQLQIDDNMPIPTNFVLSKISNNIVVGLKDYDEMYDYIKWSNTSDLPIQVQVCPIVQVYKNKNLGFSYGAFVRNYDSNYLVDEILEQPTISYIFEVRNGYFVSDIDPYPHTDFLDYYKDIDDKEDTGTFGKYVLNYTCGYRFRYVDIDNMKAGPWIHVWPDRIVGKTVTYITYSDGTFTNDIDATGTQNKYNGAELDEMIENTETENFYKDKYDGFDTNINVGEATNWLQSVASFIKGTPSFVGSVMSFLPEPIRYGMYVCLFLGVIASGYAIVKALI